MRDWFEVTSVRGVTDDDGSVTHYAATLKLGFRTALRRPPEVLRKSS